MPLDIVSNTERALFVEFGVDTFGALVGGRKVGSLHQMIPPLVLLLVGMIESYEYSLRESTDLGLVDAPLFARMFKATQMFARANLKDSPESWISDEFAAKSPQSNLPLARFVLGLLIFPPERFDAVVGDFFVREVFRTIVFLAASDCSLDVSPADAVVARFASIVREALGGAKIFGLDVERIGDRLRDSLLVPLRMAYLLLHLVAGAAFSFDVYNSFDSLSDSFRLPSLDAVVDSFSAGVAAEWVETFPVLCSAAEFPMNSFVGSAATRFRFIEFPKNLDEMLRKLVLATAPEPPLRHGGICLSCGSAVTSLSPHALSCGAGSSAFIHPLLSRVEFRRRQLSGQFSATISSSPYVDDFGNSDDNRRSGMKLFLDQTKVANLLMVLRHPISPLWTGFRQKPFVADLSDAE